MFSLRVKEVMERKKLLKTAPDTTVSKAAKLMTMKHVGAIVVVEDGHVAGIFTERDALFRVMARGRDPETTRISEVMTPSPVTVTPNEDYGHALAIMSHNGFRHLPVVQDGKPVGIVSTRSALDPALEEFVCEKARREHLVARAHRARAHR